MSGGRLLDHGYLLRNRERGAPCLPRGRRLDSMVLGEPQILGQMKQAVREADQAGTLGTTLHQLFQRSFSVAKEVRSATEIGAHSISMAAAAVRLAEQLFGDLTRLNVLFIGAGEMIELVATHFAARSPRAMVVANRTLERGEKLASRFGAQALRLADMPLRLHEFDVVVSCTASTLPIIGLGAVERALKSRRRRPMFRSISRCRATSEPEVASQGDVYLYTVDDLATLVQTRGKNARPPSNRPRPSSTRGAGILALARPARERAADPGADPPDGRLAHLRAAARAARTRRGEPVDAVLEALTRGLTQKMLHGTLAELRGSEGPQRHQLATWSRACSCDSRRATRPISSDAGTPPPRGNCPGSSPRDACFPARADTALDPHFSRR